MGTNPWDGPTSSPSATGETCSSCSPAPAAGAAAGGGPANVNNDPLAEVLAEQARKVPAPQYAAALRKIYCPSDKAFLADLKRRNVELYAYDAIYFANPYYDGTKWVTRRFDAGGVQQGNRINLVRNASIMDDAAIFYHEGVHATQPATMPWRDAEYEAYTKAEEWRIKRKLTPHMDGFQTRDRNGRTVPNTAAIKAYVDENYPGITAEPEPPPPGMPQPPMPTAPPAPDMIVGRLSNGETALQRADGTVYARPPRAGDSYQGEQITEPPGGIRINMDDLQCK